MILRKALVLHLFLLAGCSGAQKTTTDAAPVAASAPAAVAAKPALPPKTLIAREMLFGNPERQGPQISPDGKQLSWLAPVDGVMNVWVAPVDDPSKARAITQDKKRGIRGHGWSYASDYVFYSQDKGGDENWRIYAVTLKDDKTRDLTPFEKTAAQIQHVSPKFPGAILVALNNRDERFHDIHKLDLATGKLTLVQKNTEFAGFETDDDFKVRLAMRMTADGGSELLKPGKKKDTWEAFIKIPMEDSLATNPIGFDKTGKILYMTDSRGRDTAALVALDMEKNTTKILSEDAKADVGNVVIHPTEKYPQAAVYTYTRDRWDVLDKKMEADFAALRKVADGEMSLNGRTLDDSRWVVAFVLDDGPVKYYRWDRATQKSTYLFSNRPALDTVKLSKMHAVTIKSGDGLELVSYLTLPRESDPDGDGRPDRPLPMVMNVHGGPWSRDRWGLNGTHQWLADRGYAVLSVNFRGSTGFGKKFLNAANREWAGKMHDDLLDAKKWAVENKIAASDKVGIMGGSYGGYATLVGLTFTPTEFACGVDIVGPSNIQTLLETIPPYWQPMIEQFATRVGDHRTPEGKKFLTERSPLSRVDKIQRPLLIGQGANDPRVKQSEADQIVKAMKAKNIPVVYALFPDEGHGFARPENRLAFNAVTEQFLAKTLGGYAEPIGDDLTGSSLQVPEGVSQIPGLAESLKSQPTPKTDGAGKSGSGS